MAPFKWSQISIKSFSNYVSGQIYTRSSPSLLLSCSPFFIVSSMFSLRHPPNTFLFVIVAVRQSFMIFSCFIVLSVTNSRHHEANLIERVRRNVILRRCKKGNPRFYLNLSRLTLIRFFKSLSHDSIV